MLSESFVRTLLIVSGVCIFLSLWYKLCQRMENRRPQNAVVLPTSQVGNRYTVYISPPARHDPLTIQTAPTSMAQVPQPQRSTTMMTITPLPLYSRNDVLADNNSSTATSSYPMMNTEENSQREGTNHDTECPSMPPPAYSPANDTTFSSLSSPSSQGPAVSIGSVQVQTPAPVLDQQNHVSIPISQP